MNLNLLVKLVKGGVATEEEASRELTPLQISLARGTVPAQKEIEDALFDVCEIVHSDCDERCPVFALNGGTVDPQTPGTGCSCFRNGNAMFNFINKSSWV